MTKQLHPLSAIFKLAVALAGTLALGFQAADMGGFFKPEFLMFFTHLSNIAVAAYLWAAGIRELMCGECECGRWLPRVKHALLLSINVTCLISTFLLNGGGVFSGGTFHPTMLVLHYVVPIAFNADFFLFDAKGTMTREEPLVWTVFPLAYLAVIYFVVLVLGISPHQGAGGFTDMAESRFPYPFMDIDKMGVGGVAGMVGVLLVAFIAFGYVYVAIDHKLARRGGEGK